MSQNAQVGIEVKAIGRDELDKIISSLEALGEELIKTSKVVTQFSSEQKKANEEQNKTRAMLSKETALYNKLSNTVQSVSSKVATAWKSRGIAATTQLANIKIAMEKNQGAIVSSQDKLTRMTKAQQDDVKAKQDSIQRMTELTSAGKKNSAAYIMAASHLARVTKRHAERIVKIEAERGALDKLFDRHTRIVSTYVRLQDSSGKFKKGMEGITKAIKKQLPNFKKMSKSLKKQVGTWAGWRDTGKKALNAIKEGSIKSYQAIKFTSKALWEGSKALASFTASGASKVFGGMARGASLLGQKLLGIDEGFGRLAGGGLKMFAQAASDVFRGVSEKAIGAFKDIVTDGFGEFNRFRDSLTKIQIFGGFDPTEMGSVQDAMQDMVSTTMFDMETLQSAFEELAAVGEFGGDVEGFKDIGEAMVAMATATGETDLERTGQILMTTMNAFSEQLKTTGRDANDVGDILTKVANESALSVSQIGTSMQYVNQTSAALKIDIGDTAAMVGFLSNMGFEASRAGTALNQAMKNMIAPSAQARGQIESLGLSFFEMRDGEEVLRSMPDIIDDIKNATAGMGTEAQLQAITQMFGIRGGRAILAMMNETEALQGMIDSVANESTGAMAEGMEAMMQTTHGQMEQMKGTFESLKLTMFSVIEEAMLPLLNILREFMQSEAVSTLFANLGNILGQLITTITPLIETFLPVLAEKLFPVILHLVQLIGNMFIRLIEPLMQNTAWLDMLIGFLGRMIQVVMQLLPPIMKVIKLLVSNLAPIFMELANILISMLVPFIHMLLGAFEKIIPLVMPILTKLMNLFKKLAPIIMYIVGVVIDFVLVLAEALMPILDMLIDIIMDNIDTIQFLAVMFGMIAKVAGVLIKVLGKVVEFLINAFMPVIQFVIDGIMWFVNLIVGAIDFLIKSLIVGMEAAGVKVPKSMRKASESVSDFKDELAGVGEQFATQMDVGVEPYEFSFELTGVEEAEDDIGALGDDTVVEIPVDYMAGIDWEDTESMSVSLDDDKVYLDNQGKIVLNADELNSVLTQHLEPLGSSLLDIIDPSILRSALGVGNPLLTNLNVPTLNETADGVVATTTQNDNNNGTQVENVYYINGVAQDLIDTNADGIDDRLQDLATQLTEGA